MAPSWLVTRLCACASSQRATHSRDGFRRRFFYKSEGSSLPLSTPSSGLRTATATLRQRHHPLVHLRIRGAANRRMLRSNTVQRSVPSSSAGPARKLVSRFFLFLSRSPAWRAVPSLPALAAYRVVLSCDGGCSMTMTSGEEEEGQRLDATRALRAAHLSKAPTGAYALD